MENDLNIPTPYSYWVLPGSFLAGAYPGGHDQIQTRLNMTAFLMAGFDTFFDLTTGHELPSYQPILLEEASLIGRQVTHHRFSISDFGIPTHENMLGILDSIDQILAEGHRLYLHCWGGIGRTGTTVGCYFVRHGLTGKEALEKLARLYETSLQSRYHPHSPESSAQVDFILNWHET